MDPIIKTLQGLGFWSHPDHGYSSRRAIFLIVAVAVWILVPGLCFIVRQEPVVATVMRNLIETLIIGNAIPQAAIALMHRPLLERTYTEIQSALQEVSSDPLRDVQAMLKHLKMFSEWIFKGYIGLETALAIPYYLSIPFTITVKYIITGVLPPLRGIYKADYLVFEYRCNFWSWFATFIITFSVTLHLIIFLVSSHSFYWSLQHYISGLFKIVSMKMVRLDEFSDEQLHQEEFIEIVRLQEVTYRSVRALEDALNIFMLILYGECILEICMTMAALTLSSDDREVLLKMVEALIYTLFHILFYSMLGTELISTSTSMAQAIYATRWYERSVSEQRNVLFALGRSQQMAAFSTGKFFYVSRTTFGMALRTALSYSAVIRQVYGSH